MSDGMKIGLLIAFVLIVMAVAGKRDDTSTPPEVAAAAAAAATTASAAGATDDQATAAGAAAASNTWNVLRGTDYRGNDISCGKYKTLSSIQAACIKDPRCKGFSFNEGKPWCMKHAIPSQVSDKTHTFHTLKRSGFENEFSPY